MALSKVNFNSMNVTPAASKAIKFNSSNNGLETGDIGGSLVLISEQTASSSANISFTSGIDSTYKEYQFHFINIHAQTDDTFGTFQASTDGGSNYNTTATTTFFQAKHDEADSATSLGYSSSLDFAQSTSFLYIQQPLGADADQSFSGTMHLFNPSSTTFVKHFMARLNNYVSNNYSEDSHIAGYCNVTAAIDGAQFKFSSGNIDSGTIKLYGVS